MKSLQCGNRQRRSRSLSDHRPQPAVWLLLARGCADAHSALLSLGLVTLAVFRGQRGWEGADEQAPLCPTDHLSWREGGRAPLACCSIFTTHWPARGAGCALIPAQRLPGSQGRRYRWSQTPYLLTGAGGSFAFRLNPPPINVPMLCDSLWLQPLPTRPTPGLGLCPP